jgi:hypothetical protein
MSPKKQPLRRDRIRRPPKEGWSWIDRRFIRDRASALDRDSILLYFFLAAVGDKDGLSYWSDARIAEFLRIPEGSVIRARGDLEFQDLISYQRPVYQVLSLASVAPRRPASGPSLLSDIFREMARQLPSDNTRVPVNGGRP